MPKACKGTKKEPHNRVDVWGDECPLCAAIQRLRNLEAYVAWLMNSIRRSQEQDGGKAVLAVANLRYNATMVRSVNPCINGSKDEKPHPWFGGEYREGGAR